MDEQKVQVGRGGYREGAGRPKQEIIRKMRSTRAYDDEWELTKRFLDLLKSGKVSECEAFVKDLENKTCLKII